MKEAQKLKMKKWFRIVSLIPLICIFILGFFRWVPLYSDVSIDEEGWMHIHWTNWVYDYHLNDVFFILLTIASAIIFVTAIFNEGAEQPEKLELEGVPKLET